MADEQVAEAVADTEAEDEKDVAAEQAVQATQAVEKLTKQSEPIDSSASVASALMRLNETNVATQNMIAAQQELLRQNLDALAKAQANTDMSARRAAEASETVEESIEPIDSTKPDSGVKPEDIQELPTKDIQEAKSKSWWFGKSAARHGKR